MKNRAQRIADKIRAKAKRVQTKAHKSHKREDFRRQILERIMDAEVPQ